MLTLWHRSPIQVGAVAMIDVPDTAVFVFGGRVVSSEIKWEGQTGILSITGENLRDVMRRVDLATFYRDGKETDCSFVRSL